MNMKDIQRQKNVATTITFPITDRFGIPLSGAANLDSEYVTWTDATTPGIFTDLTNEAIEIGASGIYHLQLTQAEMNNDYIFITVNTTTGNATPQCITIRTFTDNPVLHYQSLGVNSINIISLRQPVYEVPYYIVDAGGKIKIDTSHVTTPGFYILNRYRNGEETTIASGVLNNKNSNNTLQIYFTIDMSLESGYWAPGDVLIIAFLGTVLTINAKEYYTPIIPYVITLTSGEHVSANSIVQTGSTATSIRTTISEVDDYFNNMQLSVIRVTSGGSNLERIVTRNIVDYTNLNGEFTLDSPLPFTPDTDDIVIVNGRMASSSADNVWDEPRSEHDFSGTFGEIANMILNQRGNMYFEFVKATSENATRNVGVGILDRIIIKIKADTDIDWSSPISTKTLYAWYDNIGDFNPRYIKESE